MKPLSGRSGNGLVDRLAAFLQQSVRRQDKRSHPALGSAALHRRPLTHFDTPDPTAR